MFSTGRHSELKMSINSIATPILIMEVDEHDAFEVVSCNNLLLEILDSEQSLVIGSPLCDVFPRYLANQVSESANQTLKKQASQELEVTINRYGSNRWWKCFITPLVKPERKVERVMLTFIEITERKQLSKALHKSDQRFKAIVTNAHDGIISIDTNEHILLVNEAAEEIFGSNNLVGKPLDALIPIKYRNKHSEYVQSFRESEVPSRPMHLRASVMGLRADGKEVPLEITISRINVDGETEMIAVVRDITEKNKLIDELNHLSTVDNLTSLYNRHYFEPLFEKEFDRARRYGKELSLLFIDVDRFKQLNDNFGHQLGDTVLRNVAQTIKSQLREIDTLCRWGGEEFLILAPEIGLSDAERLAERVRKSIEKMEVNCGDQAITVTATIGVAELTQDDKTPESITERADELMLKGKREGRNIVVAS